jgi:sugar phosphate isomerase/epimerase
MIKERAEKRDAHLDAVCRSLEELSKYAWGKDIKIGLENRYYYREIPTHDEIGMILNRFQGSNIFYWHDVGHAQIFENLGLARHIDYLEPNAYRIIGFHLHDIEGTKDHKSPHSGKFNFHILEPYVNNGTLKVLEIHPPATAGDIKRGVAYLNKIFGEGES